MKFQKINKRAYLIHIIVWAVIFALPYIFGPPDAKRNPKQDAFNGFITSTTVLWLGYFYLNAIILIPRFLYNRKYLLYLVLLLALFTILGLLHVLLVKVFPLGFPTRVSKVALSMIFPFLFTTMVSATYKTIYDRIQADSLFEERQKETLRAELSFLRSQISPHFLFNVLNNLVSLVRLKSDELEPTVLKLSSLMRYMLYDTDEEKVLLVDEVQNLQSYIDLQQQRFGAKVDITTSFEVSDGGYMIEPMLLIPFVENAFKHGTGLIKNPEITISLRTMKNILEFSARNKYSLTNETKDKTSGIGLANVRRRLALLYGDRQTLEITKSEDFYLINLTMKLPE